MAGEIGRKLNSLSVPIYSTLALSAGATSNDDQVHNLLDSAPTWNVDGYYLVCEHTKGDYLVEEPNWLANVLDIVAGLKLRGKSVIIGYSNHQMLITAAAAADSICSGTWMNVGSFPPSKFAGDYEEEMRQRATWYYAPTALIEYKLSFLDVAKKVGVLDVLAPPNDLGSSHASILFEGAQPSSVAFNDQRAFRHYLQCLYSQTQRSRKATFDETLDAHKELPTKQNKIWNVCTSRRSVARNEIFALSST